jgi:hypothetical protein
VKRRPPLYAVLGALAATVALWILATAVAGRIIWTW